MLTLRSGFTGTDRFEVAKLLGEGGFGAVYEVYDRDREERVALKTLQRLEADALYRFKKEFRLLADVSSPFLVSLHELFADGDLWYFTMELVEGQDFLSYVLDQELGSEPTVSADELGQTISSAADVMSSALPDERRLRWALSELAKAVVALHSLGMLHRDLKPGNVLVSDTGDVKLLDFGLLTEAGIETSTANEVVGTVAYMAPEQARGDQLTEAADWYAVGVMLYEALTQRWPHSGRPLEVLVAKQQLDATPPRELVAEIPQDLNDLSLQLLVRAPEERAGAKEVLGVVGSPESPGSSESLPPSMCVEEEGAGFVGRALELMALDQAVLAVRRGLPVIVEVRGRSGMGKTALLGRFLSDLQKSRSAVVLSGRCYEQESVPYKALDSVVDALCGYLKGITPVDAAALMPRDVRALSRLFPVLERIDVLRTAPDSAADVPDLQELRGRAVSALGEMLSRICDRHHLVIAIDDLQWGDLDSAILLGRLLTAADPPGMLLLLSYRSEERERSPFLRELLDRTALRAESRIVEVEALPEADALELAQSLLGIDGPDVPASAIVDESGRSPFFIHTLAHHSGGSGNVTLEGVVAKLVAEVPEGVRSLLEIIAVAGRPIASTIAIAATGAGSDGWKGLDTLRAGKLLRACGGEGDLVECYHDRVREAVLAELESDRLRACHQKLLDSFRDSDDADPERLARHLEGAGALEKAAEQAERAADSAAEKLAFGRAAKLYRSALRMGRYGDDEARELRVKLADALSNAGLGKDAAPMYLEAADGAERLSALELRRRAAFQLLATGHFEDGCDVLEALLAELGMRLTRTNYGALLSIGWQRALLRLRGRGFRDGQESAASPEEQLVMDTCWAVSMGFRATQPTYVGGFTAKFVRLALNAADPVRVSLGLSMLATEIVVIWSGSLTVQKQAQLMLEEGRSIAERLDDPRPLSLNHHAAGLIAFYLARWQECLEHCEEAVALLRGRCAGVTQDIANAEMHVISVFFYLGRIRDLSRHVPGLLQESRGRGDVFASINYAGGYGFMAWLSKDDVATTRRELAMCHEEWPVEGFLLQNYLLLLAEELTDLYCGEGTRAWDRLCEHWRTIEKSPYFFMPMQRTKWFHIRGVTAVASARELDREGGEWSKRLGVADRFGRKLMKESFPSALPHGLLVRAGAAMLRGDASAAAELLDLAEQRFTTLKMSMHASVARRCRGVAIGGDSGQELIKAAETVMTEQEIARPERVARMLCPGFE